MNLEQHIRQKLETAFEPQFIELQNESHMHAVPKNSETHFKLVLVCDQFTEKRRLSRHREVNHILADELSGPIHALALHLYSPQEWQVHQQVPVSPPCAGGGH